MALRELVAYLRRRAPEVAEVFDGVGYRDADLYSAIHRPNPGTPSHRSWAEDRARHVALTMPAQVDPSLEAMGLALVSRPARGTAEAMGEAWAAQRQDDDALTGESCLTCNVTLVGVPCDVCRGCGECCMCKSAGLLDVGLT